MGQKGEKKNRIASLPAPKEVGVIQRYRVSEAVVAVEAGVAEEEAVEVNAA